MPRRYTDDEKANALASLAANGGNVTRTAKEMGIPAKTIENWSRGKIHPAVAKLGEQRKGLLADKCEEIAWQLAESIPEKIGKAPLSQTAISFGIMLDKAQLLRGQPTEIVKDVTQLTDAELDAERIRLEETLRRSAAGADPSANGHAVAELPR